MQHDIPVASADLCVADTLESGGIVALICLVAVKLSYKHSLAKSALVSYFPLTFELCHTCFFSR